jgi:alpha-glucosidase
MWYLHSFDRGQPDLNWENPEVRRAMLDAVRFWLNRGVDGFRVDVLWLLGKDPELRDNPVNPEWREGDAPWLRLLRRRSEDGPRAHEYVRLLRSAIDEHPDRVMIGEVVLPPARAVAYHGERLDEAHLPHNFALTELRTWSAQEIRRVVDEYESLLPPGAWPNWLLGDHDFPRIASRVGPERVRLAHMLLLTLRGTPTLYYGDELGLPNARFSPSTRTLIDPQAAAAPERDRLTARTPMQWAPGSSAGFSISEQPWLPIASDDPGLTVQRQRADPSSVLSFVRSLIHVRRQNPALVTGTYRSLRAPPDVFSFERGHPEGKVRVHLNFGDASRDIDVIESGRILLSAAGTERTGGSVSTRTTLAPYEGLIIG